MLFGIGVLTLWHLIAAGIPGIRTWGLDYWSEVPVSVRWLLVVLVGAAMLAPVARSVDASVTQIRIRVGRWGGVLLAAGLVALFLVFRSRGLAYGDGYSFPGYLAGGKLPQLGSQLMVMWLDLVTHWAFHRALVMPFGGSVELTYGIISALAGVFMLWAIVRMAAAVAAGHPARRLLVASALASGSVALWFSYVEAYSLTNAAGLWALVFAIESQKRPRRMWLAWALWALACAFHLQALPLALPLAWATWRLRRLAAAPLTRQMAGVRFAVGFAICALGSILMHLTGHAVTVPLWSTPDSAYTALSLPHLLDALNQILLVAPVGALGLILWLTQRVDTPSRPESRAITPQTGSGVLAVAVVALWYFAFWVDPLLGAFRDWDLLAGFGIPMSLWAGTVILGRSRATLSWRWVPVAALAVAHVAPFIFALQNETRAALRVDRLVRQDMHYSGGFYRGMRLVSWGFLMAKKQGRWDIAAEHFRRRAEYTPDDVMSWKNLGATYEHLGRYDSAVTAYERAMRLDSTDLSICKALGLLGARLDQPERTRDMFERALNLSDTSLQSRTLLSQAYQRLGMLEKADTMAAETSRRWPGHFEAYYIRARGAIAAGDTAAALRYYQEAVDRHPDEEEVYVRLVALCQQSRDRERTAAAARLWEANFPAHARASFILGTSYVMLSQYDSANAALTRALKHAPDDALAIYYLAMTHRHLGQPNRARELAQRAARLDTTLALPWMELVYLADDAGDRAAAVAATREYLRRSPADSGQPYFRKFLEP
ncbi:MAG: tetratricopeptide repeat protein [Candidatus Zixiibacteriota bacterium]